MTDHPIRQYPDEQREQAETDMLGVTWAPPPPGDTREQLPPEILALIRPYLRGYTSTACQTATYLAEAILDHPEQQTELTGWLERMQARCRRNQKYTGEICPHHTAPATAAPEATAAAHSGPTAAEQRAEQLATTLREVLDLFVPAATLKDSGTVLAYASAEDVIDPARMNRWRAALNQPEEPTP